MTAPLDQVTCRNCDAVLGHLRKRPDYFRRSEGRQRSTVVVVVPQAKVFLDFVQQKAEIFCPACNRMGRALPWASFRGVERPGVSEDDAPMLDSA